MVCQCRRENLYEHYDDLVESPYFKISFMIFVHLVQISESNNEKKIYYINNLEELKINNYNDLGPNSNFIGKLLTKGTKDEPTFIITVRIYERFLMNSTSNVLYTTPVRYSRFSLHTL